MQTLEIKSSAWEEFCERFNDSFQGTLINLEEISRTGAHATLARDIPLKRMEFAKTEGCSDLITLHLGRDSEKEFEQTIIDPIHVRIRQKPGEAKVLEVQAENGLFHITFHAGKVGMLLEGLA
jgi:hypothetical protein